MSKRLAVTAVLAVAACSGGVDEDDVAVSTGSAGAFASSYDLIAVSDKFAIAADLDGLPLDIVRERVVGDARTAIEGAVNDAACLTVDTDGLSYLEVTFDACRAGFLGVVEIDGTLRAELTVETVPCGPAECPVAAVFELSTERLRISATFGPRFGEVAGSWMLRDPIAPAQPMTYEGGMTLTNQDGESLATSTAATWTVDDSGCFDLDFDSQLTIAARDDLGTIAAAGTGVVKCANECPRAGAITLSYGAGDLLGWMYDGSDEVVVTGPRGNELVVSLPCGQ